jgi:gliding motility-associated-like protein
MAVKLLIPYPSPLYTYLSVFILFFCSININAQCAGNDNILPDVCDITTLSSQSIDLSASLGVHTPGGTWNDDDFSGGLNVVNGTLNAQDIKQSGTYHYTYSLNNINGCTDSAVVTVTIGGYAGVAGANNTICSSETSFNLFHVFNGAFLSPQTNGVWNDDDNKGGLSGYTLNASVPQPIPNTYSYTYTVPAIGTCPSKSSTIHMTIHRKPVSGNNIDLNVCSNNLAGYVNFNLNDLLQGEDPGGKWTELSGTSEIGFPTDNIVNIQNIYNVKGAGSYNFMYTVTPENAICLPNATTTVSIKIEQFLDLTGATLKVNSNICENEIASVVVYKAILTQGTQSIVDGSYIITYKITNHTTGTAVIKQTTSNSVSGIFKFDILPIDFQIVSDYTIEIVDFKIESGGACHNIMGTTANTILSIYPLPKINNATLKIDPVCQTFDALVNFYGISNLTDGSYNIFYNLTGSNTATTIPAVMNVLAGVGSFFIPTALIPNAGSNIVSITNITNSTTHCTNTSTLAKDFIVNPLPNVSSLAATIKDICQGEKTTVNLKGLGALTSIAIDYSLSGVNSVSSQTTPLAVVAGETNFDISATNIPNVGLTTLTITSVTNSLTGCSKASGIQMNFKVNPIPSIPIANDQKFCSASNPTVANLSPQGNQYKWFDSTTSTIPLISSTPLVTGNYYVKEVNLTTGCESGLKTINVQNNATPQINSATLTIAPVCQGYPVNVNFSGTSNLVDGNYNILYNLTGSNIATAVPATLNITSGLASFNIASNLIPKVGNTTIAITNITNSLTNCSNTSTLTKVFVINALPDVTNMIVTVKNGCLGQPLNVQLSGLGTLSNITLSYTVSGANSIVSQTIPLIVSSGNANFQVPAANLLNTGNNTLIINDLTNTGNGCSTIINSVSKNFAMNSIPSSPSASNQEFCETNLATVANLIPNGSQYKWYDTATNKTPLASTALLTTANYFLKEGNAATGCESNATPISVLINTVTTPVLNPSGQNFCGVDKPTIQNLSNNTTASGNLAWYDAPTNGKLLASTNLLKEGFTYYGIDTSSITNCHSYALEVTVSLTDCTATPENFFIPDGFSPNGDGINETFQIIDIEFLFPNYTLEIFNRYGNILFKGDINKPAWDGKNSNTNFINGDTPTGVYFYVIHYNKDNLPPRQGQLYLNR